ncbi:hypothetical protein NDU88_007519 [Pleurodeles waltl]|uniref:Uncharacterized protein n=1 Tax=Pleurodeles waltl TaxID=8319 RepID=A0AAV7PTV4_PLEWA|nr:hypothetical protein NDU88_007519 [Pleurodeles waltl]
MQATLDAWASRSESLSSLHKLAFWKTNDWYSIMAQGLEVYFSQVVRSSFLEEVWAGAEGVALKRKEVLKLRKFPLSAGWEELMLRLRNMNGDSTVEDSV